jgi:hypothetical protein
VRLVGVGVANLGKDAPEQQTLFDVGPDDVAAAESWDAANEAVDAIRSRFGSALIKPARLVGSDRRPGDQQWGPSDPSPELSMERSNGDDDPVDGHR